MKTIIMPCGSEVVVSDEDYDYLSTLPWKKCKTGYAYIMLSMHELVAILAGMERPKGHHIHHKDDNKMNNQRENLVSLNRSDHTATRPARGFNVYRDGRCKPYHARVRKNGKNHAAGSFATEEEATAAYEKKKAELYPDMEIKVKR